MQGLVEPPIVEVEWMPALQEAVISEGVQDQLVPHIHQVTMRGGRIDVWPELLSERDGVPIVMPLFLLNAAFTAGSRALNETYQVAEHFGVRGVPREALPQRRIVRRDLFYR
jgi:hypothetical protein